MDSFVKSAEEKLGGEGGNQNDLVNKAEGFMSGSGGEGAANAPTSGASGQAQSQAQGHAGIMGNAKTLYQGIQDKMGGKTDVNDAQLAGAADGLLKAAKTSGLDKDGQYTDYFTKAEGFLQKYQQGGSGAGAAAPTSDASKEAVPPKE